MEYGTTKDLNHEATMTRSFKQRRDAARKTVRARGTERTQSVLVYDVRFFYPQF